MLVADDQEIVRTGLATILDAQDGIDVVAQVRDGQEAVELARRLRPDVCLLDIRMPRLDGIAATRLLAGPGVEDPLAVVLITTFDSDENVGAALRTGARGLLLKDAGPGLLAQAVRAAADGDALLAPRITARLLATLAGRATPSRWTRPVQALTAREEEVAAAVARGLTNAEITGELYLSLSTVKFHLAGIMTKTGARSRVEVVIWAYETGRAGG